MAPAMNTHMLEHDAVRANLATLGARGVRFVDPGAGYLACGWIGKGRLAEPDEIVEAAQLVLQPAGSLLGHGISARRGAIPARSYASDCQIARPTKNGPRRSR
jgi:phosphopantothenoylcysteine decarboxylase/phosphopantothenate--cysteine ligase